MLHPNIAIIWNFWPLSMLVWTPLRVALNVVFSPIYVFTFWIPFLWNLIFEETFFTLNVFFDGLMPAVFFSGFLFLIIGGWIAMLISSVLLFLSISIYPMIYTIPAQIMNIFYFPMAVFLFVLSYSAYACNSNSKSNSSFCWY